MPCFICVNFIVSGPPFNAPPAPTNATCSALAAYMNSLPDNYTWNCRSTTANSVKVCAYNTDTPKAVNSYCRNYSAIFPQVLAGSVTGLEHPLSFLSDDDDSVGALHVPPCSSGPCLFRPCA